MQREAGDHEGEPSRRAGQRGRVPGHEGNVAHSRLGRLVGARPEHRNGGVHGGHSGHPRGERASDETGSGGHVQTDVALLRGRELEQPRQAGREREVQARVLEGGRLRRERLPDPLPVRPAVGHCGSVRRAATVRSRAGSASLSRCTLPIPFVRKVRVVHAIGIPSRSTANHRSRRCDREVSRDATGVHVRVPNAGELIANRLRRQIGHVSFATDSGTVLRDAAAPRAAVEWIRCRCRVLGTRGCAGRRASAQMHSRLSN